MVRPAEGSEAVNDEWLKECRNKYQVPTDPEGWGVLGGSGFGGDLEGT